MSGQLSWASEHLRCFIRYIRNVDVNKLLFVRLEVDVERLYKSVLESFRPDCFRRAFEEKDGTTVFMQVNRDVKLQVFFAHVGGLVSVRITDRRQGSTVSAYAAAIISTSRDIKASRTLLQESFAIRWKFGRSFELPVSLSQIAVSKPTISLAIP